MNSLRDSQVADQAQSQPVIPALTKKVFNMLKARRASNLPDLVMMLELISANDKCLTRGFDYNNPRSIGKKAFMVKASDADNSTSFVILNTGLSYQADIYNYILAAAKESKLKVTFSKNYTIAPM